jgi:Cys-tRNA(Pro)/Cys-tRNA(Cys) deacylase
MTFNHIQRLLEDGGFPYTLHEHSPVTTVEDARAKVPHLTVNLIKTIVFHIKDSHWILAGVNGTDRIDYKQLGDVFGVNRKLLRSVSPKDVETELGFEIGGVGPFPVNDNVKVMLDEGLLMLGMVFCGSGKNTITIEMNVHDLAKVASAKIGAISKK